MIPESKCKVGLVLFHAWVDLEDGTVELEEWHCRTIRQGYAYFTMKCSSTWGKRSTKNGDFGWLPKTPDWCQRRWRIGSDLDPTFDTWRTTKAAAYRAALPEIESAIRRLERIAGKLRTQITKQSKKAPK